jgi:hypothetical protein
MATKAQPLTEKRVEPEMVTCFVLRGITYVPHYIEPVYVRPGYGSHHFDTYSASELTLLGAQREVRGMWPRPAHIKK